MISFFNDDPYDPGGRGAKADEILSRRAVPHLILDRPDELIGHGAGNSGLRVDAPLWRLRARRRRRRRGAACRMPERLGQRAERGAGITGRSRHRRGDGQGPCQRVRRQLVRLLSERPRMHAGDRARPRCRRRGGLCHRPQCRSFREGRIHAAHGTCRAGTPGFRRERAGDAALQHAPRWHARGAMAGRRWRDRIEPCCGDCLDHAAARSPPVDQRALTAASGTEASCRRPTPRSPWTSRRNRPAPPGDRPSHPSCRAPSPRGPPAS